MQKTSEINENIYPSIANGELEKKVSFIDSFISLFITLQPEGDPFTYTTDPV